MVNEKSLENLTPGVRRHRAYEYLRRPDMLRCDKDLCPYFDRCKAAGVSDTCVVLSELMAAERDRFYAMDWIDAERDSPLIERALILKCYLTLIEFWVADRGFFQKKDLVSA